MMRRYTLGVGERTFVVDVQEITADRFEVVVGEQRFEVALAGNEELLAATITPGVQAAPGGDEARPLGEARHPLHSARTATAAMASPGEPVLKPGRQAAVDALKAPMPGVILEMNVKAGDTVQRGQQVAVLEAMKMHNFIGAPRAGVIAEVCVAVGQAVGHGEAIVRFQPEAAP